MLAAASLPAFGHDGDLVDDFGSGGLARMGYTNVLSNEGSSPLVAGDGTSTYCTTRGTVDHGDMVVARVKPDGSPDFSFSTDGRLTIDVGDDTDDTCVAIAATPDGKVVVAGESYDGTTTSFALARIKANGALDTTFGTGGKQLIGFDVFGATNPHAAAVAVRSNGTILVAGGAVTNEGNQFVVARLLPDGSYDTAFNLTGRQRVAVGSSSRAFAMVVDAQDRIVLAGYTKPSSSEPNLDMAVARLLADGSLDPSFDGDGRATVAFDIGGASGSNIDIAHALALQADGKIVIGGEVDVSATTTGNVDFGIARLTANGALDPTFGSGGRVLVPFDRTPSGVDQLQALRIDADRIVAAGYAVEGAVSVNAALVRLRANGSRDPTFGNFGRTMLDFGFPAAGQVAFGVGSAGARLYVTGIVATSTTTADAYVAALENDGLFADGFE
jgi:uncharacterized delta-60 repeat protein